MKRYLLIIGLATGLTGCASYTIQPVSAEKLDQQWRTGRAASGYVFYQPELYFLVTPAAGAKADATESTNQVKNNFTVTPIFLPNPARPYRVTTFNFLAKSDFTFNFKDGWQLSSIADKADNTTLANTLSGQMTALLAAGSLRVSPNQAPAEQQTFLLHPVYDSDSGANISFSIVPMPK